MLTYHIITLFPESFSSYLDASIVARAIKNKKIKIKFYNPRDFTKPKNKSGYTQVDDRPYGGGPGMVMQAEPILKAVDKAIKNSKKKPKIILFSPSGEQFTNASAHSLSKKFTDLIMICGRYEGVDARVAKATKAELVSVGPYVLTGGELPAMAVIDATTRQLPGVLGKDESVEERREASRDVYTRPEVIVYKGKKHRVPKILLSGDHGAIDSWRASS